MPHNIHCVLWEQSLEKEKCCPGVISASNSLDNSMSELGFSLENWFIFIIVMVND